MPRLLPLRIARLVVGLLLFVVAPVHAQAEPSQPERPATQESTATPAPTALPESTATPVPTATPAAVPTTVGQSALDTVRTKDGGLYRGTLLEHSPGLHSTLRLYDGSTRVFQAVEIDSVELAAQAVQRSDGPAAAPVPIAVASTEPSVKPGQVLLEAELPHGYELSARGPRMSDFEPLCVGDCTVPVDKGSYEFELSRPGVGSWRDAKTFDVAGPSRVVAVLERHRAQRIVGGVMWGAGLPLGFGLLGRGLALNAQAHETCDALGEFEDTCEDAAESVGRPQKAVGAIMAAVAAVVGGYLVSRRDHFHVEVSPRSSFGRAPVEEPPVVQDEPALAGDAGGSDEHQQRAEAWLKQHGAEVRACIQETPALVELQISSTGGVASVQVFGDADKSQQDCLRQLLQGMSLPAGAGTRLEVDVQPALR